MLWKQRFLTSCYHRFPGQDLQHEATSIVSQLFFRFISTPLQISGKFFNYHRQVRLVAGCPFADASICILPTMIAATCS